MRADDPALHTDDIEGIDRAILYARDEPTLNPAISAAFIDALLDKRLRLVHLAELKAQYAEQYGNT